MRFTASTRYLIETFVHMECLYRVEQKKQKKQKEIQQTDKKNKQSLTFYLTDFSE